MTPEPYLGSAKPSSPQSWNKYAYVVGDPVNSRDRKGLNAEGPDDGDDGDDGDGDDDGVDDWGIWYGGCYPFFDPVWGAYYGCGISPTFSVTALSGSGGASIKISNLSNSSKQAVQVQNDVKTLEGLIDGNADCAKWLGGATAVNNVINSILNPNNMTGIGVGVGNFGSPSYGAVAGTYGTNILPAGSMQITVNLIGAFFNPSAPLGNGVPATIRADTSAAQAEILIHELGHLLGVLQGNDNNASTQSQNNQDVLTNCSKVVFGANF
jgi:hypothetical protein